MEGRGLGRIQERLRGGCSTERGKRSRRIEPGGAAGIYNDNGSGEQIIDE